MGGKVIEKLLLSMPYKFVQIEYQGKKFWGIAADPRTIHHMQEFRRYVINGKLFTLSELRQIQIGAVAQDESEDLRMWIYQAICERTDLVTKGRWLFYFNDNSELVITTYADQELGIAPVIATPTSHSLKEYDDLLEVVARQKEGVDISLRIRDLQSKRVDINCSKRG
jgi:hypothetical protein